MIPSRLRSRPFGSVNRTKWRPWMRTPCRCTLRNSLRRRIRSRRERFRSTSPPPPLSPDWAPAVDPRLNGQPLAPLGPAPSQDFPAGLRAHSLAKPVRPLAAPIVGLIRALHALFPRGPSRRARPTPNDGSYSPGGPDVNGSRSDHCPDSRADSRLSSPGDCGTFSWSQRRSSPPLQRGFPQLVEKTVEIEAAALPRGTVRILERPFESSAGNSSLHVDLNPRGPAASTGRSRSTAPRCRATSGLSFWRASRPR